MRILNWLAILTILVVCCRIARLHPNWVSAQQIESDAPLTDDWSDSFEAAQQQSRLSTQPILLKFEAQWCEPCQQLRQELSKPEFDQVAQRFIRVRIDVDRDPQIAEQFNISAIPALVVTDSRGHVLDKKTGMLTVDQCVQWLRNIEMGIGEEAADILTSTEQPTRTEIAELISYLGQRESTPRQVAMERLFAYPEKTKSAVVGVFLDGSLSAKLSALEILTRWEAPIADMDPWVPESLATDGIARLQSWAENGTEGSIDKIEPLSANALESAQREIAQLLSAEADYLDSLSRLTRYGPGLLPTVYDQLKKAKTDSETERLTALRYWLVASNKMRLQRPGLIIELASRQLQDRRAAATALMDHATSDDELLLLEIFADSDPLIREIGLKALNQIGSYSTNQALTRLLKDPDPNVRAAVLKQLAESPSTQMIPAVKEYLETETDLDLIVYALKFLKEVNPNKALEPVLKLAEHESWQVRAHVAEVLAEIEYDSLETNLQEQVSDAVLKLIVDPDGFVVSRAIEGLPPAKTKKTIQQMTEIAKQHPALAEQIVNSIARPSAYSMSPYSSAGASQAVPFLEEFLEDDQPQVRVAGIVGLGLINPDSHDDRYEKLLADPDQRVRIAAANCMVVRMESIRKTSSRMDSYSGDSTAIRPPVASGSLFSGIVGRLFGTDKRSEPELEELPSVAPLETGGELNPSVFGVPSDGEEQLSMEPQDSEPPAEATESVENDTDRSDSQLKLPPLVEEKWIDEWASKTDREIPWFEKSVSALHEMMQSEDDEEKSLSAYLLAALDRNEDAINLLKQNANRNETWFQYCAKLLPWLPFEERNQMLQLLLASDQSSNHMGTVIQEYSKIRNPAAAEKLWDMARDFSIPSHYLVEGLNSAYLGDSISYYSGLQSDSSGESVDPQLVKFVEGESRRWMKEGTQQQKLIALSFLYRIDRESAGSAAMDLAGSDSGGDLRNTAIRVALLSNSEDQAINESLLTSADETTVKTILRFLAFGDSSIQSPSSENGIYLFDESSFSSFSNGSSVKVRIPKAPAGTKLSDVSRWLDSEDEEVRVLATYLAVLLQGDVDIQTLINYWQRNQADEEIAKLTFQAIAAANNDQLTPTLTRIYEQHGKENPRFASQMYWTIRPMTGSQVIKLRSRIRDEIGMSTLNSYN